MNPTETEQSKSVRVYMKGTGKEAILPAPYDLAVEKSETICMQSITTSGKEAPYLKTLIALKRYLFFLFQRNGQLQRPAEATAHPNPHHRRRHLQTTRAEHNPKQPKLRLIRQEDHQEPGQLRGGDDGSVHVPRRDKENQQKLRLLMQMVRKINGLLCLAFPPGGLCRLLLLAGSRLAFWWGFMGLVLGAVNLVNVFAYLGDLIIGVGSF